MNIRAAIKSLLASVPTLSIENRKALAAAAEPGETKIVPLAGLALGLVSPKGVTVAAGTRPLKFINVDEGYTLSIEDNGYDLLLGAAVINVIIPDNATDPLPLGFNVGLINLNGSSPYLISPGNTISWLTSTTTGDLPAIATGDRLINEGCEATLKKVEPENWIVYGNSALQ